MYDGRWDKYIEPDEDGEEADPTYGVPVLAACAAILGIGGYGQSRPYYILLLQCRCGHWTEGSGSSS